MRKFLIVCFLTFAMQLVAMAQSNTVCPFGGKVNCRGECGLFEDRDGDGFCDNGIVNPESLTPTPTPTPAPTAEPAPTISGSTSPKPKIDAPAPQSVAAVDTIAQVDTVAKSISVCVDSSATTTSLSGKPLTSSPIPYDLILIASITLLGYFLSEILVKKQKLKKITHRRFWNLILLVSCLVSCLLGLFLVIQVNCHVAMSVFRTVRNLHVQFGLVMTILAIIHIIWHLPYFKNIFTRKA